MRQYIEQFACIMYVPTMRIGSDKDGPGIDGKKARGNEVGMELYCSGEGLSCSIVF